MNHRHMLHELLQVDNTSSVGLDRPGLRQDSNLQQVVLTTSDGSNQAIKEASKTHAQSPEGAGAGKGRPIKCWASCIRTRQSSDPDHQQPTAVC